MSNGYSPSTRGRISEDIKNANSLEIGSSAAVRQPGAICSRYAGR